MLDLEVLAFFVSWCCMLLFSEMKDNFFASPKQQPEEAFPEENSYGFLRTAHNDLKKEVELLDATLKNLRTSDLNYNLFKQHQDFRDHCSQLLERYKAIRDDQDMWFRDNLFYAHAYRISLTFARLNVAQTLALFNFSQMQRILDAPIPVQIFYFLSFAILSVRLLINLAKALQHALAPTEEELKALPSMYERLTYELSLDHINIINDIVWVTANVLTNYPQVFGLSNPVVNTILLGCLTFDFVLSMITYYQANLAYNNKKREYEDALAKLRQGEVRYTVLLEQLEQLKFDYEATAAKFQLFLLAGTTILAAFSLIASSALPFFLPLGAALCVFATALYLTADKFGNYQKNQLIAQKTAIPANIKAAEDAETLFFTALFKNTVYPLLFMMAAANFGWFFAIVIAAPIVIFENMPAQQEEDFSPKLS